MSKYYDSIDNLPVYIFNGILSGKMELDKLCYEGTPRQSALETKWETIFNEYLKEFGLPPSYEKYLRAMAKVCKIWLKVYAEGKKSYRTLAEHNEKIAFIEYGQPTESESINTIAATVSKFMGFAVDPTKTSVRQFYSYLELIKKSKTNG